MYPLLTVSFPPFTCRVDLVLVLILVIVLVIFIVIVIVLVLVQGFPRSNELGANDRRNPGPFREGRDDGHDGRPQELLPKGEWAAPYNAGR